MKEALCYQSNREMRLHGNAIHMKPAPDGALAMDVQSSEAVYVSDVFDCGEVSGTWDELHLHFEQLWAVSYTHLQRCVMRHSVYEPVFS